MTRCDFDGVFYRVFCVSFLAIAFSFTLILTNVFIDIDGLLASKEKAKAHDVTTQQPDTENNEVFFQPDTKMESKSEVIDELKSDSGDNEENYRAKRSLDNQNFKFHIKNPKMKQILTNKLSTLLEELDIEETKSTKINKLKEEVETAKPVPEFINARKVSSGKEESKPEEEMLHLAMHNILLQGIIGHMDLNEVYKKVHLLVKNFEPDSKKPDDEKKASQIRKTEESAEAASRNLFSVESKFFEELVNCEELQKQLNQRPEKVETRRMNSGDLQIGKSERKAPQMLIKTIIDIKTLNNRNDKRKDNKSEINDKNVKGLIKLVYNGRPIKFSRLDDNEPITRPKENAFDIKLEKEIKREETDLLQDDNGNILDVYLDRAIAQYLKKYPSIESKYKSKRLKRHVKLREPDFTLQTSTTDNPSPKKNDDEELYVEIETHFDSKGIKGEKKKKLVRNLVEKIQKAIHANIDSIQEQKKGNRLQQIKKRLQNPLELNDQNDKTLKNKILIPFDRIVHRKSSPISKSVKLSEPLPKVADQVGEEWKKTYFGSNFLSNSKSINSGEKGLVDLDYSNVLKSTGIPQRLQQPLNTENIDDNADNTNFFDLGDLKFYIKDIDGTGFAIGFNQYVGEAPDPENIKLFTGLQQLIKEYHNSGDENDNKNVKTNENDTKEPERSETKEEIQDNHEMKKREVRRNRKSAFGSFGDDDNDYHSNEYKVVFDNHFLPYDSYSQIFEDQNKKVTVSIQKQDPNEPSAKKDRKLRTVKAESLPLILDENIFKKHLKPSEIFGLASLIRRKKRSPTIKVQRYSNLKIKNKNKISRFINTDKMSKRFDKKNSRRNKRQIDKIRIIASDTLPQIPRHSDENVFVVSDENMFADRGAVREVEIPEQDQPEPPEERSEYINTRQIYEHETPFHFSQYSPQHQYSNIFSARSRQNALMSKYPHLFLEEISRSKEDESPYFYRNLMGSYANFPQNNEMTTPGFLATPVPLPQHANDREANIDPEIDRKPNYKLTLKVIPKNNSDVHSGFKEIHTSINKSINKNGLVYSSQVNVSEVSKIENTNKNIYNNNNQFDGIKYDNNKYENNKYDNSKYNTEDSNSIVVGGNVIIDTKTGVPAQSTTATVESNTEKTEATSTSYLPLVKSIKEQQERMKQLLRQHRKRIDDQLDTLKKEKQNIESIIIPESKKSEMIDVVLPLNPPQVLHLNKAEAGQLITSALMKLHDAPQLNDVGISREILANLSARIPKTTTQKPTTTTRKPHPNEPEKVRLLKTIQRNENLTSAILFKLDTNTNLLQHFLRRLADKMEPSSSKLDYSEPTNVENSKAKDYIYPKDWKYPYLHTPFFNSQPLPNLEVNKNGTHVAIPFVYAYQQPYPLPNKQNTPIASVIYQGHIHTNTNYNNFKKDARMKDEYKKLPEAKREANQTRFFYDENVENDFKLLQPDVMKKNVYDIHRIKSNMTRL